MSHWNIWIRNGEAESVAAPETKPSDQPRCQRDSTSHASSEPVGGAGVEFSCAQERCLRQEPRVPDRSPSVEISPLAEDNRSSRNPHAPESLGRDRRTGGSQLLGRQKSRMPGAFHLGSQAAFSNNTKGFYRCSTQPDRAQLPAAHRSQRSTRSPHRSRRERIAVGALDLLRMPSLPRKTQSTDHTIVGNWRIFTRPRTDRISSACPTAPPLPR